MYSSKKKDKTATKTENKNRGTRHLGSRVSAVEASVYFGFLSQIPKSPILLTDG